VQASTGSKSEGPSFPIAGLTTLPIKSIAHCRRIAAPVHLQQVAKALLSYFIGNTGIIRFSHKRFINCL
jgi:hypothetical protein